MILFKCLYCPENYSIKAFVLHCRFYSLSQALHCRHTLSSSCVTHRIQDFLEKALSPRFLKNPVIVTYVFTFKTPITVRDKNKNFFSSKD